MDVQSICPAAGLSACLDFLWLPGLRPAIAKPVEDVQTPVLTCSKCGDRLAEVAKGMNGEPCCRPCIRSEDEALLEPFTVDERAGMNVVASVLDKVSLKYWKPGEQPAQILDWLYLGDLGEAMDFDSLGKRSITAVLNVMNWWEVTGKLPHIEDLEWHYKHQNLDFLMVDSDDRLFFNMVEKSWPAAEAFLEAKRAEGVKVLVNCAAGHNRSACVCVLWLVVHENMSLVQALQRVLLKRGTILSNCGFRLLLVRLALSLQRLGTSDGCVPSVPECALRQARPSYGSTSPVDDIIRHKRRHASYDYKSVDLDAGSSTSSPNPFCLDHSRSGKILPLTEDVVEKSGSQSQIQRTLRMDLLASIYHQGTAFTSEYEYTSDPPVVIGSGWSGDVMLCRRRERTAVKQNKETSVRCVKRFDLLDMVPDHLEKLKNEATIYLSLEHPHIARLFDVFETKSEVCFVMQYCSGGTLEAAMQKRGAYGESDFQDLAVPMLLALNYIHLQGIVHRDIKPRNFVFESDEVTIKLIDFGFSVKMAIKELTDLRGCLGTLGYIAPEVLNLGFSLGAASYTFKCDIWSLGVVFYELLAGQPAFHRERGTCDGYTEEVVMREIQEISDDAVERLLVDVPLGSTRFLKRFLTVDQNFRPSARDALRDAYLMRSCTALRFPSRALSPAQVLGRIKVHSRASKTSRAWLMAVARSPTCLPWSDFMVLRDTFKMFDIRGLSGTINLDTFLEVVGGVSSVLEGESDEELEKESAYWEQFRGSHQSLGEDPTYALASQIEELTCDSPRRTKSGEDWQRRLSQEAEIRNVWKNLCGKQESLSYCEFLAALLPPIEDVFEDVPELSMPRRQESPKPGESNDWNPKQPISEYLPLMSIGENPVPVFDEDVIVSKVVKAMNEGHHRWVIVQFKDKRAFFEFMDITSKLLTMQKSKPAEQCIAHICCMRVGELANCSNRSAYIPKLDSTSLTEIFQLLTQNSTFVRRIPIVSPSGEMLHVISCGDVLQLMVLFELPRNVLKSQSARIFDRRAKMMQDSVLHDEPVLNALRIMITEHVTTCPATSRELSGDMGGIVALNVVSAADLKWIFQTGRFDMIEKSVDEFISWRTSVADADLGLRLRKERLKRFNVVSVRAGDSLYMLTQRLVASRLPRIFLQSDEISRIVGTVCARDIVREILDQIL